MRRAGGGASPGSSPGGEKRPDASDGGTDGGGSGSSDGGGGGTGTGDNAAAAAPNGADDPARWVRHLEDLLRGAARERAQGQVDAGAHAELAYCAAFARHERRKLVLRSALRSGRQ